MRRGLSYHITYIPINDTTIPIHDSKLTAKSDFLPEHSNAPIPDIKKLKKITFKIRFEITSLWKIDSTIYLGKTEIKVSIIDRMK